MIYNICKRKSKLALFTSLGLSNQNVRGGGGGVGVEEKLGGPGIISLKKGGS